MFDYITLPSRFALFFSSVIEIFEAPAGIVATCTYASSGSGSRVKIPVTGRQSSPPQLTEPLFAYEPFMEPLARTA